MTARAIMVLGTSSHVGKSLLTTALCRIFADEGVCVAPFKSQNMSLNSAATIEGLEIGRAQAVQAEAARVPASVHMNPVLLKPAGEMASQVVVRGKIWGRVSASDYHRIRVEELMPLVRESYGILAAEHEVVVLEGAGSPAEINLRDHDIVNLRMAEMADAKCILVGDIDRGGVFASIAGTIALLEPAEQERIAGFVINKFRGDIGLLMPGVRMMEERLGRPCLGVVPYLHGLVLEEEDSVGLEAFGEGQREPWMPSEMRGRRLRIAVIAVPSFSNFTDFDALRHEPSVDLRYCRSASQLEFADVVILPGSKQTVEDLLWMRAQGFDVAVKSHAARGLVVGVCGGMQWLGKTIADPYGVEHDEEVEALGLLPFSTRMNREKTTRQASGRLRAAKLFGERTAAVRVRGYEIHVGETVYEAGAERFAVLEEGGADGCVSSDGRVFGTYLHGIFDEDEFRHLFLAAARSFHDLEPAARFENWAQRREESFDRLAEAVRGALDLDRIFDWVGLTYQRRLQIE